MDISQRCIDNNCDCVKPSGDCESSLSKCAVIHQSTCAFEGRIYLSITKVEQQTSSIKSHVWKNLDCVFQISKHALHFTSDHNREDLVCTQRRDQHTCKCIMKASTQGQRKLFYKHAFEQVDLILHDRSCVELHESIQVLLINFVRWLSVIAQESGPLFNLKGHPLVTWKPNMLMASG